MNPEFAVVRKGQRPWTFSGTHPQVDVAMAEAERLCRKERVPFMVVAIIAEVNPVEVPVQWNKVPGFVDETVSP